MSNHEQTAENTQPKTLSYVVGDATSLKAKSTPTPWIRFATPLNEWIGSMTTGQIACDRPAEADQSQWEDNAALIVRAVNAHEAMKKALELILDDYTHGTWWPDSDELIPTVKKALALAEGKEQP
jgi:hypothetical protein